MPDSPTPDRPYTVPRGGSLGLLAAGYRGLDVWREKRGTDWMQEQPDAPSAPSPEASALTSTRLVIVSGLPRSGTSMVMQMVEAAGISAYVDEERPADPSNPKGYFEHKAVKRLGVDSDWLVKADRHAVKVVAPLLSYLPTGPTYQVVYIDRDLDEVLASQKAMLARDGVDEGAQASLRAAYQRYERIAKTWIQNNAECLFVEHAEVIHDPLSAAERLRQFLNSESAALEIAKVVDSTLHRQRT